MSIFECILALELTPSFGTTSLSTAYNFIQNNVEMKNDHELKTPKNKLFRLILLTVLVLFFLFLAAADWRMETYGVPEKGILMIRKFCAARGYKFHVLKLRAGIINGINASGFLLDGDLQNPSIRAEEIHAEFSLRKLFQGIWIPFDIHIRNASVSFPLFPEYREESRGDFLPITGVNAELTGIPGKLRLIRASGYLGGIRFQSSGTIDNLLHYSGARGLAALHSMIFPASGKKNRQTFSAYQNFIRNIQLSIRKNILYSIRRMDQKNFQTAPECSFSFHFDFRSFTKSSVGCILHLPSFEFGKIHLAGVEEIFSLKNGQFAIDGLKVVFQNGGYAEVQGEYDSEGQTAKGLVRGKCSAEDILCFFDESFQNEIASRVQFGEQQIGFHGTIDKISLSGQFLGNMTLLLPYLKLDNMIMRNADISLSADSNILTGIIHSAEVNKNGKLSGTLRFENGIFQSKLKGEIPQAEIMKILPPGIKVIAAHDIRPAPNGRTVLFSGDLEGKLRDIRNLSGGFLIDTGEIRIRDVLVEKLSAFLKFSPTHIQVSELNAETSDGTRIKGGFSCCPGEHRISADIICSGAPYKLLNAFGGPHREFIRELTGGITWPADNDSVEVSASFYADYGKHPFCRISGSAAARDFAYEKIPFRYGAVRFIVDADDHLILPDVVLETKDGKMYIMAEYTPGPNDAATPDPNGDLNFTLKSTISGNDMIRSLYPLWKSEYIDFPEPVNVESCGSINYVHPEKTHFTASITNGSCICQKLKIRDIDTTLRFQNNILSFYNASGTFADGRLLLDYLYDFSTEKGKAALRLSGANLKSLLESFGQKDIEPEYRNGMLSAALSTKISYNKKDELLLNGSGGFSLTGTNLWTIPILGSLLRLIGKAWSLESFGTITKVDGSFALADDKLILKKIRSDGGFVALNANGFYRWQDNFFDVNVRAELLRNALPFDAMSHILSPVSWILEQKLKGNFNTYQWEQTKK